MWGWCAGGPGGVEFRDVHNELAPGRFKPRAARHLGSCNVCVLFDINEESSRLTGEKIKIALRQREYDTLKLQNTFLRCAVHVARVVFSLTSSHIRVGPQKRHEEDTSEACAIADVVSKRRRL